MLNVLLILAAMPLPASCTPSVFSVSSEDPSAHFSSLDQALQDVSLLSESVLTMTSSTMPSFITQTVHISHSVALLGQDNSILISGIVYVEANGLLTMSNVSLAIPAEATLRSALEVRGSLVLQHSTLHSSSQPFLSLYGFARFTSVIISNCNAATVQIQSGSATLEASQIQFESTSGFAAVVPVEHGDSPFSVNISDSVFTNSAVTPLFSLIGLSGRLVIRSSRFQNLYGNLVFGTGKGLDVAFTNCTFLNNAGVLIVLVGVTQTRLLVSNASFAGNDETLVQLIGFDGVGVMEDCEVTGQRNGGVFAVGNPWRAAGTCEVSWLRCHISDFNVTGTQWWNVQMMHIEHCRCQVEDMHIHNVTMMALPELNVAFLFWVLVAELHISHLHLLNSGGVQVVNSAWSVLSMSDFYLDNPSSSQGVYVGVVAGTVLIQNGYVTRGSALFSALPPLFFFPSIYFAFTFGTAHIQNVTIVNSTKLMGPAYSFVFCSYDLQDVTLNQLTMYLALMSVHSSGSVSGVAVSRVQTSTHVILMGYGIVSVRDVQFVDCEFAPKIGVLGIISSSIVVRNLSMVRLTVDYIAMFKRSVTTLHEVTLENCSLRRTAFMVVDAQVDFQSLLLSNSHMQLLLDTTNNVTSIAHSAIHDVHFATALLYAFSASVAFSATTFANITARVEAGLVVQGGRLSFDECEIGEFAVTEELGWQLSASVLSVRNSRFRGFNYGLFQATRSNLSVFHSQFEHAFNPVTSLKSFTALGTALSCVDCPSVALVASVFRNLSAAAGGALSVQRRHASGLLQVTMQKCEFIDCVARFASAGAAFVQNVSFTVTDSEFVHNRAAQGGAIFAALRPWHTGIILHSRFVRNTASRGGALQWTNAEVQLVNVTFQANSADYGPDVASYGVALSAQVQSSGVEVSGAPLSLVVVLLDHYGHRVNLTAFKYLTLQSTSKVHYLGNSVAFLKQGVFTYTDLVIFAQPDSALLITAAYFDRQEDFSLAVRTQVPIRFRGCVSGEATMSDRCMYCPPGYVSFSPEDENCAHCPANAYCPGGNQLVVNASYWRAVWNTSTLHLCPFPPNCLGGENSTCAADYAGPLCNLCSDGRMRALHCTECRDVFEAVKLSAALGTALLFRGVLLKFAVREYDPHKLFCITVLLDFLQFLSALSFLRVSYSPAVSWTLHTANILAALLVPDLPLSCFLVTSPLYAKAVIGSAIFPGLLASSVALTRTRTRIWTSETLVFASSLLLYTPFIAVVATVPLLVCESVETQSLLFFDMNVECWSPSHMKYVYGLAVPTLILYLATPLAVAVTLHALRPTVFATYFPLWIAGYIPKLWTLLPLVTKCLFAATLIACVTGSSLSQVTYGLTILICLSTLSVSLHKRIYSSLQHFFMAEASFLCLALTLGFLSYYMFSDPGNSGGELFANAMLFLLIAAYVVFWSFSLKKRTFIGLTSTLTTSAEELPVPPNSLQCSPSSSSVLDR